MEQTVLTATDLTMRYHNTTALDSLTLDLPQGRIIGLLGPNGSGKTTFIKLAAGLLTPKAGSLAICGKPVGTETKALVSYLPDRPYFSKARKITELLDYFQDFYSDFDRSRAEQMLSALGISPLQGPVQGQSGEGAAGAGDVPPGKAVSAGRAHRRRGPRRPGLHLKYHYFQL